MIISPIIPIWLMILICIILIYFIITKHFKNITYIIIIILLFISNLRIMIPNNNSDIYETNLDILFIIDTTMSINAEDYNNNTRLSAIKEDCKYIINKFNGARFALITFDNIARINIPYTNDSNIINEYIDIIKPIDQLYAKGSSMNTPIETILNYLDNNTNKDKIKVLFFISDGEITDDSKMKSYKEIAKYIQNGAVLGYGTENGGYMKARNVFTETQEYYEYYGKNGYEKAISKIDENNLETIANDLKVDYIKMTEQKQIDKKINEIKKIANKDIYKNNKSGYTELYYISIIPILILLILEFKKMGLMDL